MLEIITPSIRSQQYFRLQKCQDLPIVKFPRKMPTVCYGISSWTFDSKIDRVVHGITSPTRLSVFAHPLATEHIAENKKLLAGR